MSTQSHVAAATARPAQSHTLVREVRFPARTDLSFIIEFLRAQDATGTLEIALSEGGVRTVCFREERVVVVE